MPTAWCSPSTACAWSTCSSSASNRRTAIAQTPYSAFPGSATRLERIAGATTDLQHIVHQGLTSYDATFWVGANAVIRKRALDDIAVTSYVGDWEIRTYIKDVTVIEDTESTIDLAEHGWRLLNYPERLSYSATPPDFGSLCIQRRRWANGGLLLLPKLHRKNRAQRRRGERPRFGETFLRWNYMSSVSSSSVALLVLLAFPFGATLISPLLGIIALPYFIAMAADLRSCGYKRLDVFRIYGFNLLLVPVNLGGTAASLTQAITASRSTFARTPKVRDRTVAPLLFVLAPLAMVALAAYTLWHAYRHHLPMNVVYAALNVVLLCYAIVAFIGVRYLITDVSVHAWRFVYRPVTPRRRRRFRRTPAPTLSAAPDWRVVLQYGSADPSHWPKSPITDLASGTPDGVASHGVHQFRTVFQPIVDLASRDVVGYEALTRFEDGVRPQHRLADAAAAGTAPALESALAFAAIASAAQTVRRRMAGAQDRYAHAARRRRTAACAGGQRTAARHRGDRARHAPSRDGAHPLAGRAACQRPLGDRQHRDRQHEPERGGRSASRLRQAQSTCAGRGRRRPGAAGAGCGDGRDGRPTRVPRDRLRHRDRCGAGGTASPRRPLRSRVPARTAGGAGRCLVRVTRRRSR